MSGLWSAVDGPTHIRPIDGTLYRVVESQAQVATSKLCDDLDEADLLESLLDTRSKPPLPHGTEHLHYLLATPWRYPPLLYGSRFGSVLERSLFYGSLEVETCLCESAYYRLLFLSDMAEPPTSIGSQHTVFCARYRTTQGVQLQLPPFDTYRQTLTDKSSYGPCQTLGNDMRNSEVEGFEYYSARRESGTNVALFDPAALVNDKPFDLTQWLCRTQSGGVTFIQNGRPRLLFSFASEQFSVNGSLPRPA